MRVSLWVVVLCALGRAEPAHACEWRYALIAPAFEPVEDVSLERLRDAWQGKPPQPAQRALAIAASSATRTALASVLGEPRGPAAESVPALDANHWAIVPAHELRPGWHVVRVGGTHPLERGKSALDAACPAGATANIDFDRVSAVVMSGTTAMTRSMAESIARRGVKYTVAEIAPWFAKADLVHVSNEVAFVRDCDPMWGPKEQGNGPRDRSAPEDLKFCTRERDIKVLEALNVSIVELTGSHLHDFGRKWIEHTLDLYAKRGWKWFGGGRTQIEATEARIVEHAGNRFGFVGCNWIGTREHALTTGPGIAACNWSRMIWQVQDLRRRGIVPIVSIQHEEVYKHAPPELLVIDARRLAEAGAAFVLGSQAHYAHPWEVHHGAFVHYGPGNLLFEQGGKGTRDAVTDKLYVHAGTLLSVERLHTRIEGGRPRKMTAPERWKFLARLARALPKPAAEPAIAPIVPPEPRRRPDSLIAGYHQQHLIVTAPEPYDPAVSYPLVIDLAGGASADDAFVVAPKGALRRATARDIARFMQDKYRVDPARTTIRDADTRLAKTRRSRRRR